MKSTVTITQRAKRLKQLDSRWSTAYAAEEEKPTSETPEALLQETSAEQGATEGK
jgi:hypothetical protein